MWPIPTSQARSASRQSTSVCGPPLSNTRRPSGAICWPSRATSTASPSRWSSCTACAASRSSPASTKSEPRSPATPKPPATTSLFVEDVDRRWGEAVEGGRVDGGVGARVMDVDVVADVDLGEVNASEHDIYTVAGRAGEGDGAGWALARRADLVAEAADGLHQRVEHASVDVHPVDAGSGGLGDDAGYHDRSFGHDAATGLDDQPNAVRVRQACVRQRLTDHLADVLDAGRGLAMPGRDAAAQA